MRVLFTCQPGFGHFHPLVPIAQTLADAGHEVAFACAPSFRRWVENSGFQSFSAGIDWDASDARATFTAPRQPTREAIGDWMAAEVFGGATAEAAVPDLVTLVQSWQADVVIRDAFEFGGWVAADCVGIPHATAEVGAFRSTGWWAARSGVRLNRLRASFGLAGDPTLAGIYGRLYLSSSPPSYQLLDAPLPSTARVFRPAFFDRSGSEELPSWVAELPDQPTVYATMGTVANRRQDVLKKIVDAFRGRPVNLIVTVGRNRDPSDLGQQPPNEHVERYIPQSLLLPHCDLVLTHGGASTVLASLIQGLPLAVFPVNYDQWENARRCATIGVARFLEPDDCTPGSIWETAQDVLRGPPYRANASRIRAEIEDLPPLADAVELIEELAASVGV
jgi:UDP:flavonoid glycosyltransferase YjiC (YdhE family)